MQQRTDELDQMLADAAEFLLPVAMETDWPCRLEIVAWLIAIRDTFKDKGRELQ